MIRLKKVLIVMAAILLVAFIGSALFVAIKGKTIAQEALQKALKRKVDLESINLKLPFAIEVDNLAIENLITAKKIILVPSFIGFISGRIALNQLQLVEPEFVIIRQEDGSWNLPISQEKSNISIAGLVIKNGVLKFIDRKIDPSGFAFKIQDIYLNIHTSLLSMRPLNVSFNLKSNIISQDNKLPATINANGWIDLMRKDMKAKVRLSDLDAVQFSPYYREYTSSPVEEGRIFFSSDLIAKNNDLTADCHLKVKDLVFKQEEGKKDFSISVLDILTGGSKNGAQGEKKEVNLDFVIKTKLDKPRVDWAKITGSVVAQSLGAQLIENPEETIEKVKGLGKDLEQAGKEILKEKMGEILGAPEGAQSNSEEQ